MNRLIIVDDEPKMLEQLCSLFDWEKIGFKFVASFHDGLDALTYMEENAVDTILTDIKMPHIDGLEVARICHEQFPQTTVVLISAFRDFEYARKALQYNVTEYITKPIDYNEFYQTMLSISSKKNSAEYALSFPDMSKLSEIQEIFSDLLCGVQTTSAILEEKLKETGIDINPLTSRYVLLNLHINNLNYYLENTWRHEKHRLYNAISHLINFDVKNSYFILVRYSSSNIEIVGIFKDIEQDYEERTKEFILTLQNNLQTILHMDFQISTIGFFDSVFEMTRIEKSSTPLSKETSFNDVINSAMSYIENNYAEQISLETIAKHVSLSASYFSTYFKQHTGENFLSYLSKYRMSVAMELLKTTDIKISTICDMVGYKNFTHFYTLFKSLNNNLTPAQYREQIQK